MASRSARSRSSSSASRTACPTASPSSSARRRACCIHTGDFKIDQTPLDGEPFDLHRFAQLGAEGVLALFGDSTNIDRRGYTGSEIDVEDAFEEIFTSTEGKIVVAAFASSIYRMQILVDLAAQFDRRVAFVGRGMKENSQIAQRLGYLQVPTGRAHRDSDVPTSRRRTSCAWSPARRASRTRRCRASPSTTTATSSCRRRIAS